MKNTKKSNKATAAKRPETTIIAMIEITKIIDDQMMDKNEALDIIGDIVDGLDADHIEIKNVKTFEHVEV